MQRRNSLTLFLFSWDTKLTEEPGEPQVVPQEPMNILNYSGVLYENKYPCRPPPAVPKPSCQRNSKARGRTKITEEIVKMCWRLEEYLAGTWTLSLPESDVVLLFSEILHGFFLNLSIPLQSTIFNFYFGIRGHIGWSSLGVLYLRTELIQRKIMGWEALLIPSKPI